MFGLVPHGRWNHESDHFLRNFFGSWTDMGFNVDVKDTNDAYVLHADLPGIDKENIKLDIRNGYLSISVTNDESVENETDHYIRRERRMASAQRQFYVGDVDENKIEAKCDRGVLEVTVPKLTQQMDSRRIIDIQ